MYYRASEQSPWRSKRGTSDVENANLHLNGVLDAPNHSPQLAHCLFTDSLGRRNIRMAINNGDFCLSGSYDLRRLHHIINTCADGPATIQPPGLDAKSLEYLNFFDRDVSDEQFGFYASLPKIAPSGPITVQVVHHEPGLPEGKMQLFSSTCNDVC
jgi:hypothetical protein